MAYKIGHCTQTGKQLMVRDSNGKLNSLKPDACEADLLFSSGSIVHILLCEEAMNNPDIPKIFAELMHPAADSFKRQPGARQYITEKYGEPLRLINPIKLLKKGVI